MPNTSWDAPSCSKSGASRWMSLRKKCVCLIRPVARVARISYLDPGGIQKNIPASRYLLDNDTEPCRIRRVPGVQWPATLQQSRAIKIDIQCGYGDSAAYTPQAIRLYLLAKLVEQFDPQVKPDKDTVQSSYIDRLLDRYRIMEVG